MIRGFVVCGESVGCPNMTEKLLIFASPTPLSYLPRAWGWGLKVEIQLFSSTASTQPNTTKDICTGTHARIQEFLSGVGGGGWGPGSSTYFTF